MCCWGALIAFSRNLIGLCEGAVSLAELTAALKFMNSIKAPGSDGFTAEFYTKFWGLLGPLLLRVINVCFYDGCLPESMNVSLTRLVYKKRGNIRDLKNWRPISLLNVDYKICSKAITLQCRRYYVQSLTRIKPVWSRLLNF